MTIPLAGIHAESPDDRTRAESLAAALALLVCNQAPDGPCLCLTPERLELRPGGGMGPLFVDFLGGAVGHRHRFGGGRGQGIAKAAGLKGGVSPSVIDATAGLGKDAFVLASLGCHVRLMERSPIIAALLWDGLERAGRDPAIGGWVRERMRLIPGDAARLLPDETAREPADLIYLDPMYPHRTKSALVKKEMRLFRELVGEDGDAAELLRIALTHARQRVVVKRPRLAEALTGPRPSFSLEGKTTRYDIYVIKALTR
ncbi:MAG: class I SAM-dependent methyltransferase [Gammaproteobacteria bacterium]|nr:class I SAM-dependent methyltransferase [Gammaproteobacteria bacterium]MBU1654287.1 class I SAM-dependent methyltransferase [Gammaproteobacteria bacterium]MBU1960630.1 class I SAM-dependent methyltransferase [Gammaproteobacteria bacterium]